MIHFNNPLRIFLVMTFVVVFTPLMALLPWLLFPLQAEEPLSYPDGITFHKMSGDYSTFEWDSGDWDRPSACPVVIHVYGKTYDADSLASQVWLREAGWTERVYEHPPGTVAGLTMTNPGRLVECSYRNGRLTNVTVKAYPPGPPGSVAVTLKGRRIDLPCTRDALIQVLGPPLPTQSE